MSNQELSKNKQEIVDKHGPWFASNIHLGDNLYTMNEEIVGDEIKVKRILQVVSDLTKRPLNTLRVLDLGCHEGIYSIEFARHGATVIGVEARTPSIEKARFAKHTLGLDNLEFVQDDVRNLRKEKHGEFDVVLCLGLLYHLDCPDVFEFIENMEDVCKELLIIDTRIALGATANHIYKNTKYFGHFVKEHDPGRSAEEKLKHIGASIDNLRSFWLTRHSIFCFLSKLGFTSVYECHIPAESDKAINRITILGTKGNPQDVISAPLMRSYRFEREPEQFPAHHKINVAIGRVYRLSRLIPEPLRRIIIRIGFLHKLFRTGGARKHVVK